MASTLQFEAGTVAENYRRYLEPVLFAPWAERLVAHAGVRRGDVVVDIASGTGAVARAAARAAGPRGHVIATDISARMLAYADSTPRPGAAAVEVLLGSALDLDLPDASADVVLCQQGLQFMDDRLAVLRECRRVLRPGGVVAMAVWAAGERLDPFDTFADALSGAERTFSNAPATMSVVAVVDALCMSGFDTISVGTESLVVRWPTLESEVSGLFGTPFGPLVERMGQSSRTELLSGLRGLLGAGGDHTVDHTTTSVFGRGMRPEHDR